MCRMCVNFRLLASFSVVYMLLLILTIFSCTPLAGKSPGEQGSVASDFSTKLLSLTWVAYSPTNFNPDKSIFPSRTSIRKDLQTLHDAGFNGLVTYGADVITPQLAKEAGFEGMVLGIWNPLSAQELQKAKAAARNDILVGFAVGNEGLDVRYDFPELKQAIEELKAETGKPVTTTEQFEDYNDAELISLGDWVFPNVHPYWHGKTDVKDAVRWTSNQFIDISSRVPNRVVLFKEVGLPSGGDTTVNEHKQAEYYRLLKATNVKFVWFEAFDQPWKTHEPVEPHWGLFERDRTPKEAVKAIK